MGSTFFLAVSQGWLRKHSADVKIVREITNNNVKKVKQK